MKRYPVFRAAFLVAAVSLCGLARAGAQEPEPMPEPPPPTQQPGQPPKPAGREYPPPFADDQDTDPTANLNADTLPLTGVQIPTVGSQEMRHSYLVPGFQYGNLVRSSTLLQPAVSNWNSTSFVAGNVSLLEEWSRAQLSVNYTGGGTFSTDKTQGNGYFHQLGLVQAFIWRRLQLSFIDQFSYLPQTQFGFGAASSLATPGISGALGPSLPALQSNYQPSQSIFSSIGSRYSNSITSQIVYSVSPRGSLTFAGSYGLLRFVEAGNIDTVDTILSMGYDYALSKRDTIGVLYRFSGYRYQGDPEAIDDHVAQLAYGRKVTGRLAFQLFAGPEVTRFRIPLNGSSQKISGSGGANLSYAFQRTNLSVSYNHGVSGGSGVFTGSNTDQVQGNINRRLTRVWNGNVTFGYARNASLGVLGIGTSSQVAQTFNSWFVGGGLDRPLGRTANLTIGYTAYLQESRQSGCPAGACTSYVQHQISASFQWHTRPLVLR